MIRAAAKPRRVRSGLTTAFRACAVLLCLSSIEAAQAQTGAQLADTWCGSCHAFPSPKLLDRQTWLDYVLPNMGLRMGFKTFRGVRRFGDPEAPKGTYAAEPMMTEAEWARIVIYYEHSAPLHLPRAAWKKRTPTKLFEIELPAAIPDDFAAATAIFIDEIDRRLLVGDSFANSVKVYDPDLDLISEIESGGVVSHISRLPSGEYALVIIGETIEQTEELNGSLATLAGVGTGGAPTITVLARKLHRPVAMGSADFNGDDASDFIIAGFGAHQGELSLHLSQVDDSYREVSLRFEPGATSISIVGEQGYVLMAQADERILRISGLSEGRPETETLLRFPPLRGSSSMSVTDFDGDGFPDLLYTAGDNVDISQIYKPYHGIYIFSGRADGSFEQTYFFPFDGATSAVAEDFDGDGDSDIAAIAYYGNLDRGLDEAGFVYLENTGDGMAPHVVGGIGPLGRFIAITAGDVDGDGDKDIALASLSFGAPGPMTVSRELLTQWTGATRFVLLRNTLH